jgi:hypothetical protein
VPSPAVPIEAKWIGAPPDYLVRVQFDRPLETIDPGEMYLPNWRIQMFDYLCQVIGGWAGGVFVTLRFRFLTPLVAPDFVTYRKLTPQLVDIQHGLPVEAFIRYPIHRP